MKPYCLNPEIKDRDLRLVDGIARLMMIILMLLILLLVCCSCGSTKVATQMVRDVRVDTVYLSNVQYDSIYIYKDHASEHHLGTLPPVDSNGKYLDTPMSTDTLYIKDVSIEYHYKLLKGHHPCSRARQHSLSGNRNRDQRNQTHSNLVRPFLPCHPLAQHRLRHLLAYSPNPQVPLTFSALIPRSGGFNLCFIYYILRYQYIVQSNLLGMLYMY